MSTGARLCIGFAGHARSGKSTLAGSVAQMLGRTTMLSFGRAVTERAQRLGYATPSRQTLVTLGAKWVATDPDGLCRAVLAQADPTAQWLLVDGVRHPPIWSILTAQLTPTPTFLVYVDTPRADLRQRLVGDGLSPAAADQILGGPTEEQVELLQSFAALVVDGRRPAQRSGAELVQLLTERGYDDVSSDT